MACKNTVGSALEFTRVSDNHVVTDLNNLAINLHIASDSIVIDIVAKAVRYLAGIFDDFMSVIAGRTVEDIDIFVTIQHFADTEPSSSPAVRQ